MKRWLLPIPIIGLLAACSNQPETIVVEANLVTPEQPDAGHGSVAESDSSTSVNPLIGPVLETMDAGGYTYVRIKTALGEVWAAGPGTMVDEGQVVEIKGAQPMTNFHSGSMDRTFDLIYFASAITSPGDQMVPTGSTEVEDGPALEGEVIAKAEGGITVEEIFTKKTEWVGKSISLRGKVVKFTPDILGKNWLHIQDGSGGTGTNDITITSDARAEVGDVVLIEGVLVADKDFGYGYKYDLIVEDAKVSVE